MSQATAIHLPVPQEALTKFTLIGHLPYKQQAVFYLNAYWRDWAEKEKEKIWEYTHEMAKLDPRNEQGCDLDELAAHKFLENMKEAMTAIELREELRKIDLNNDHHMSLLEYLLHRFGGDVLTVVTRPQENSLKIKEIDMEVRIQEFKRQIEEANKEFPKAQAALEQVRHEIAKIEATKHDLEEKSKQDGVKGKTYQQQLNIFLSDGHNSLNESLIHAEAAVRIVKHTAEAHAKKLKECIENSQNPGGIEYSVHNQGSVWWVERELEEVKKYQPPKKAHH
jgi:Skp family chaperone for outer membrane proteins